MILYTTIMIILEEILVELFLFFYLHEGRPDDRSSCVLVRDNFKLHAKHEQQVLLVRTTQQLNDNTTKDKTTMVVIVVADLIYNN